MPTIYRGRVFSVEVERKVFPNGQAHEVAIVRHPPSVVIIPIRSDGRVILVHQFRPSLWRKLWELPAGGVEAGETPEAAAVRECEEEIGLVPKKVEYLRGLFPTPGFCDEELIFYRAWELEPPPVGSARRPDADEDINAEPYDIAEARAMVARGSIVDLKTAYGLTLI
jgi:ADP-ribose pyrophosphatase